MLIIRWEENDISTHIREILPIFADIVNIFRSNSSTNPFLYDQRGENHGQAGAINLSLAAFAQVDGG